MNRRLTTTAALVLAAIVFLAINVFANSWFRSARLDLTADRLYTLSEGTRSILSHLDEPVTLRFFFSNKAATPYAATKAYGKRVRDMLEEYASLSNGKLRLEVIDPEPFSEAEDQAVALGLRGAGGGGGGDVIYFGLVGTNAVDDQQVIPFFTQDRERFLEYDLTKLIYSLATPEKKVVGVISSLPLQYGPGGVQAAMRGRSRPMPIYEQLRQQFDVRMLEPDLATIDKDVGLLLIAHPAALSDKTLYAIDQYVLRGGHALVFVDPHSEMMSAPGPMGMPSGGQAISRLDKLFTAWGVSMAKDVVVGDRTLAQQVAFSGPNGRQKVSDFIVWLGVDASHLNRSDVVTAQLSLLAMGSAGALSPIKGASTHFEPLITSSPNSMLVKTVEIMVQPDPAQLLRDFVPTDKAYVLAARVSGPVKSAFPDGPPPDPDAPKNKKAAPKKPATPAPLTEAKSPVNLIIVADTDMLDQRFWAQVQDFMGQQVVYPVADNANFVINAVDNLLGNNALIGLRSRGVSVRPFTVVEDIRRDAEARYLAREKQLQDQLKKTEARIKALESQRPKSSALLSPEQEAEIEKFRAQMLQTRKELRAVQRDLRKDISTLENWLRFINIGLMPLVVMAFAVGLAVVRRRRRAAEQARG
jgi:ABC-type uncharacterized transport system involved in gliding motility auxiliary subunit